MKKLFSVLVLILASSQMAAADDCSFICNRLGSNSFDGVECTRVMNSGYTQYDACMTCGTINGRGSTTCIREIINKTYDKAILSNCAANPTVWGTIDCMKNAGMSIVPESHCDLKKLHNRVKGAMTNFNGGNFQGGMNSLHHMDEQLNNCLGLPPVTSPVPVPIPPSPPRF